jgi:hypothetical protein
MKKPAKQMIFALPFFLEKNVNTLLILGCSFKNTVFGRETVKLETDGAKNSAGFGTLCFLLSVIFIV